MNRSATLAALLLATAAFACPRVASAYRPFDGTDADVAELGEFELEIGPAYAVGRGVRPSLALPAFVLNEGIAPGWELVADGKVVMALSHVVGQPTTQLDDTDVQVKHVFRRGSLQGGVGPSVAAEAGPLLPMLGGEHGFGFDANIILSQRISVLTLHLNGGAAWTRSGTYAVLGTLIIEGPEAHRLRPVTELLVASEMGGGSTTAALVGVIWRVDEALSLDMATRGAFVEGAPAVELRAGLTWAVPLFEQGAIQIPRSHEEAVARL